MNLIKSILVLNVGTMMLGSCAQVELPSPTPSIPSASPIPTLTLSLPDTPEPTNYTTPISNPPTQSEISRSLQLPTGDPQSEWNGISIMPDAIAGDEISTNAYAFTTHSSSDDILNFYLVEPLDLGWQLFGYGPGEPGELVIFFTGNEGILQVSIIAIDEQDSLYYVMLSQE